MAAALAASLPAPASAPAPAAPTYEAIPPSMSTAIDIEAEIPLTCVQLDAMVVTKIVQHGREAPSASAHGLLLGLDLDGILEVSNSFPLPSQTSEEDDKSPKSIARYQASMLRSLKEVQGDDNVVGFYQATTLGAFFDRTLVDTQAIHQERLRHGGVVVVHDVSQTARGNASFRGFRLTSSFMDAYKKGNFSSSSLMARRLKFSSILEEIPVRVRTNALASAFLERLVAPGLGAYTTRQLAEGEMPGLGGSFSVLGLGQSGVSRSLELVSEAIDSYRTEDGNVAYLTRQITREKLRAETYVAKRKEENVQRVAQGLSPLPEEDVSRLFKVPGEPSRLESMLLLGQVDAYAKSMESLAGIALVNMYGARGGGVYL
ncbi:translation initiation factor 3 subunit 3 [Boletus edulis]|uniref:Eukaryotic translation initiation factor 3 subunit H n=1 Tax=Boletus edulis BED1 TaxID=1328754 RepID=A0AAD4C1U9_BOLED|nr:translation initiation factor 3 subunit 3 [Boletus edulis]KAF8446013.1 translation initiation factor 3 subunit 3 [Boletus edulis BED1]